MVREPYGKDFTMTREPSAMPPDFDALRRFSAAIGADPLLIQAAGGNTSVKADGVMWIKASGTRLENALREEIMVPVALGPLLRAVAEMRPEAEKAEEFVVRALAPGALRPSIETTVHALMPQRIVVHVHCVETIAHAVRADAEERVATRLAGLAFAFVPYARPGLPLARAIAERLKPGTDILVLGNHGLAVAAGSVAEAEALLEKVVGLLREPARPAPPADIGGLRELARGSGYRLPATPRPHGAATDPVSLGFAAGGSLYPDHVIFLGVGSAVARPGETAAAAAARLSAGGRQAPASILFPGKGVLMRGDATSSAEAMAGCLADVTARIGEGARLRYLSAAENDELTGWDAEKYRQKLAREGGGTSP